MISTLNRLYSWYGKKAVLSVIFLIVVLTITGAVLSFTDDDTAKEVTDEPQHVRTVLVAELSGSSALSLIGTVEAVDEAAIESEVGGRITSVSVRLGDRVRAGQVIAQLENASERAGVLQAEGAYEAAVANAAQSKVGVSEAETNLASARGSALIVFREAFTTVENIIHNVVDDLYANPSDQIPGFRLDASGKAPELNRQRSALVTLLEEWQREVFASLDPDDAEAYLTDAKERTVLIAEYINTLSRIVSDEDNNDAVIDGNPISFYENAFLAARNNVNATLQKIENAQTAIVGAEDALTQAELQGSEGTLSASDSSIKQALGVLRAAEARLADTIIRTPISGSVNALPIKTGEFVSPQTLMARVANNNALEVTTFVSQSERKRITIGDSVLIENEYEGTVTSIAPALDAETNKIEVRIGTETNDLLNGDTVRVEVLSDSQDTADEIIIPITALKVETNRTVVFTVSEEGVLIAHEISEGPIVGDAIVIREGVTPDMEIVLDARGHNEGDIVTVTN